MARRRVAPPLVLAHYMVCCPRFGHAATVEQYAKEFEDARTFGIDGFALNMGAWSKEAIYPKVARAMFAAALKTTSDIKLVLSTDNLSVVDSVDAFMEFHDHPNYLHVNGKPVLTTYGQDGEWGRAVREELRRRGVDVFLVVYYHKSIRDIAARVEPLGLAAYVARRELSENPDIDGYFVFLGPFEKPSLIGPAFKEIVRLSHEKGKVAMLGIAPYYRGIGVKNSRVFEVDGFELMQTQWRAAIEAGADWVEFVTWNDWGESTYLSPVEPDFWKRHWGRMLDHTGYLEASRYYMDWFRAGSPPPIRQDRIFFFYRVHPKTALGYTQHDEKALGQPRGWEKLNDSVFFTSFLSAPVTLEVRIGKARTTIELPAGLSNTSVPMTLGAVSWRVLRQGAVQAEGTLAEEVSQDGTRGNFNYTSGELSLSR